MTTNTPIGFIGPGIMGAQMVAALCATSRDGLDNAAPGLLFEELSGVKR
jgi:hypothetical protein